MLYMVKGTSAPKRAHKFPKYIHDTRNIKVGLMGGSFNPPHEGHFTIAKLALKMFGLDEIWWLVSPQNPLKSSLETLPISKRYQLCIEKAKHPKFRVLILESNFRTKNSYSLIKIMFHKFPKMKFIWIMGSDNLLNFHKWYKASELSNLLSFAIFNRKNFSLRSLNCKGAYILGRRVNNDRLKSLVYEKPPKWGYLHNISLNISSTKIRKSN